MRAFVVFATLFAVACARPDIGLKLREQGYNYQTPGQGSTGSSGGNNYNAGGGGQNFGSFSQSGVSSGPSGQSGFVNTGGFGPSGGTGFSSSFGPSGASGFGDLTSGSRFSGPSSNGFGGSSGGSGGGSEVTQGQTQVIDISGGSSGDNVVYKNVVKQGEPIITKHFYVHEAPEEEESPRVEERVQEVRPQKNYKIIFIKAPSQPNPYSPANYPVFPQNEEKTIVYVLSKKHENPAENGEIPTPPPAVTSKPEVFFVKYKTKEEAEQAVAKIQDSFQEGGPGYNSPASFAESLGAQTGGASSSSFSSGGSSYDEESLDVRGNDSGSSFGGPQSSSSSSSFGGSQSSFGGQQPAQADFNSEYLPPNKRQALKRQARRQG